MKEISTMSNNERDQEFLAACFEGDLESVKYLTSGKDFSCIDVFCSDHNAPVHIESVCLDYAVEAQSLEIIAHLISLPQGQKLLSAGGTSAFRSAYKSKQNDIVQYFIASGINKSICESYYDREKEELESYFAAHDLYQKLNESTDNKPATKKLKI